MKSQLVITILFSIVLSVGGAAFAAGATRCRIMTIEAKNSNTGLDPKLAKYRSVFKKEPFTRFNSFELINEQAIELVDSETKNLTLPDSIGGSLKLRHYKAGQFQLTLTIARADHRPVSIDGLASPGSPLFAAGMKSKHGVWIFGVACDAVDTITTY